MIIYIQTDLFTSPAQTLVNTVNTVGVMGKGIAKVFKEKYPQMFKEYKKLCDERLLSIGNLHLWRGSDKWVLNFPTKTTWQKPSDIRYLEAGLQKFCETYEALGITSISFPPIGCGNGQLDWAKVKPLMQDYLGKLPLQIFVHEVPVGKGFVPEHLEGKTAQTIPATFENFLSDISDVLYTEKGHFYTLSNTSSFEAMLCNGNLKIARSGGGLEIPIDALSTAWSTLQSGILSVEQFGSEDSSRYKSYLFPILAQLPYVTVTKARNSWDNYEKDALLLKSQAPSHSEPQKNLWQSH